MNKPHEIHDRLPGAKVRPLTPAQARVYDQATEGRGSSGSEPTGGGRAIDQLKSDLQGSPIEDTDDPSLLPQEEAINRST